MDLRRIAVLLEGRAAYERNVLRGIRDFAASREDWLIRLELPGPHVPALLEDWKPDAVLFQAASFAAPTLAELIESGIPCLHLSDSHRSLPVPCVGLDNEAVGKSAADYFRERRFIHLAFLGVRDVDFSHQRGQAFGKAERFELPEWPLSGPHDQDLLEWLKSLPRPCGLFATHDEASFFVSTLCREAGIRVPEDIAILGVDNDTLICELAHPKLSSVSVPSRRIGREAATRLARLLDGEVPEPGVLLLPPSGIITRQSTDVNQTEDELVNRALRLLRGNLDRRPNIDALLRELGVSRRLLERRFQQHLGRSPLQELQRLRIETAKTLLIDTRLPLHAIAEKCGCRDASHLAASFRKLTGTTPGQFRKQTRRPTDS